jgi:Asp-tRNA(Asn)/Glu-tRNA(Gln) amidotransferase A subunit family amidase
MRSVVEPRRGFRGFWFGECSICIPAIVLAACPLFAFGQDFAVEEAAIEDVQRAIQRGDTTCRAVVQGYVDRAKAYNGVCTQLVTKDGAPVSPGLGAVRAGAPLVFPSATVPVSEILPDFDQYQGLPIEFGRMEATQSDPGVQQQFGMLVGMPDAGQVNALSTLNLRGERSVTCSAECDLHPSDGALPAQCPAVCDAFRQQPDALERAAELDAQYGRNPDLDAMPMYCAVFSFKDVFDTKDMRSTGGADVSYAMDAAPEDATIVTRLREKGAIIYAKANLSEYNGGGGNPGGAEATSRTYGAGAHSTWPGTSCNPYDTARETGGSSSGSAASVGANLVTCSICEETGGSCRQPAWRNGVVGLVTTKGLMPYGGSIGAEPYLDRAGIHCRTVDDTARVLDALKDPELGYFDPRDVHSALPKALVPDRPYASFTLDESEVGAKPLAGMRIGIVREYMVKHAVNDAAISDQIDAEIKRVLRDELGAELVESFDPAYPDDPSIPNMEYNFQEALAEIVPIHLPELLHEKTDEGGLTFAVPGHDVTGREYMVQAAEGFVPLSKELNLRSINESPRTLSFSYHMEQYLLRRGDVKVKDWATLNANSKHSTESRAVAMLNWENALDLESDGITRRIKMRDAMRLVLLKVMRQNDIDVLVNPTITIPPTRIGYASEPVVADRPNGRFPTSANLGIPELTVPAGFDSLVYEPEFELNAEKDAYESVSNSTTPTFLDSPMPIGISFWAGPGDEPVLFEIASAYEAATKHRRAPAAFGPLRK